MSQKEQQESKKTSESKGYFFIFFLFIFLVKMIHSWAWEGRKKSSRIERMRYNEQDMKIND